MPDNLISNDLKEISSKDYKYFDDQLYLQCREYIKYYLVLEEIITVYDMDLDEITYKNSIKEMLVKMGVLLNELNLSINRLRNTNIEVSNPNNKIDRFNYELNPNTIYASITDMLDGEFKVSVHHDDAEKMDSLLNSLDLNITNCNNANHNLVNKLNHITMVVNQQSEKYTTNEEVSNVLELIKNELRI